MEALTKKDIEPLQSEIHALFKVVNRIEHAILGDEAMKIDGIASKVARHEKYISNSKIRIGLVSGFSTGIGIIIHKIWEWISFK
ncbi:MAG: hypothetical protein AABY22_06380 [Nanoarchaeota archaeon]